MKTNRIKIRPNYSIIQVSCIYLIITKRGSFFITSRNKNLLQIEASFFLHIRADYYKLGEAITNRGKFVTNWDRYYISGQLLQIGA